MSHLHRLSALDTGCQLVAVVSSAFVADSVVVVVAVVEDVVVAVVSTVLGSATAVTSRNTAIAASVTATVEARKSMCVADRQASRR